MEETVAVVAICIHQRKDEKWMMILDHYRYSVKPTDFVIDDVLVIFNVVVALMIHIPSGAGKNFGEDEDTSKEKNQLKISSNYFKVKRFGR